MNFYHDQQRDLLIYEGTSPLILQAIPEARQINGSFFAVPRNLRNSQILRYFNYPVAPIITDENYDWPIEPGKTPLPHQKQMANFQVLHPRCFNLSDPGTMKTMATLWAADFIMLQHPPGEFKALIVGPLTILETVWGAALARSFLGRRTFEIIHGSPAKRQSLLDKRPDFGIINFDGVGVGAHTRKRFELDGFSKYLAERNDIKLVIVDEASGYRDAQTKRHRIARLVIGERPWLWMLTGTPTPQAPTDAYGLAKMVNKAHGKSFRTFQQETMIKVSQFKWVPQRDGYDKARQLLSPAIRIPIETVYYPKLTMQRRAIALTDQQKKLMADLKRDLQVTIKPGQPITSFNEAGARQKFLQISLGAVYDSKHAAHRVDASPRLRELHEVIEGTTRKVLIFCPLTSIVHLLYESISKRWKCGIINGEISARKRPGIIRAFETEEDFKVMILDAQSTAHGINEFVVADTVVWYGPVEKGELFTQGNRRADRPGQNWPVTAFQFVSNPLEKEIFDRLEKSESLQGSLLAVIARGEL